MAQYLRRQSSSYLIVVSKWCIQGQIAKKLVLAKSFGAFP
jgi:hypothetical protein